MLFLDEPTSGIDPIARKTFWALIREMAQAGQTIFVSTHYMDEAEYCYQLALMYHGRVIALGTPDELRAGLNARTLLQLDTSNPLETMRTLEQLTEVYDVAVFGGGLHIGVKDADSGIKAVRACLKERNIPIKRIETISPSLEDVFVTMIETEERRATNDFKKQPGY